MAGNDQQTWIYRKFVPRLSVSSVQDVMPSNLRRVYVKDLEVGNQPPDTYILGVIQDIFTIASKTDRVSRKLVLREVLDNGCSGLQMEVFTYGQYARQLEGADSNQLWAAMSGAHLRKYMGFNKQSWCSLSVRIGAGSNTYSSLTLVGLSSVRPSSAIGESFSSVENTLDIPRPHTAIGTLPSSTGLNKPYTPNEMLPSSKGLSKLHTGVETLSTCTGLSRPHTSTGTLTSSMGPPTSPMSKSNRTKGSTRSSLEFVTLSKVKENTRQNVYAVVNEVIKEPTITKRKIYHTILILVDSSCGTENVRRKDLLFHIFCNDMSEPLPYSISRGDILRIRDMRGEMYYLENKYHGKIYSSKQLAVFTSDLQDPIVPRTTKEDFVLTDQDLENIQALRKWWASASSQLDKENRGRLAAHPAEQCNRPYFTISDIGEEMVFSLYCQVVEVRCYSDAASLVCILRVRDGTHTTYWTTVWHLETASYDLNTPTDVLSEDEASVCITVIKDAETAAELKEGAFVELQQVRVEDISSNRPEVQDRKVFEFVMDRPTSRIIALPSHHLEARKISSRLKDQNDESELDSCGTIQLRLNDLQSTPPRQLDLYRRNKYSPNRINSHYFGTSRYSSAHSAFVTHLNSSFALARSLNDSVGRNHISAGGNCGGIPFRPSHPKTATQSPHLPSQSDSWEQALGNLSFLNVENRLTKPQERRVDEQLENVPRAAEEAPQELSNQQDSYNGHANNSHLITENSEINFPDDIPASTQKDSNARWDKVYNWLRNGDEETKGQTNIDKQVDNSVNDPSSDQPYPATQEDCILPPLTPSTNSSGISAKEHASRKRAASNEDTCKNVLEKRITKEPDTSALNSSSAKPSLESPGHEPVSVKYLLENAEDRKMFRLKGKLAQVLVKTKSSCLENNKCCVHDIVQGLCQACMKYYYRSDLLNDYQLPDLMNSSSPTDYLPCQHCSTHSVTESERPRTVVPLFGLHLVIEENSNTSVMLNLSGDGAHFFFGQEATFSMAVEQPAECLAAKYAGLLSFLKKDIEVAVMTIVYYGTKCYLVYQTKINV